MPYPSLQDVVHEWQGEEGQTEATMLATQLEVIADELRTANRNAETANLIAYQGNVELSYTAAPRRARTAHSMKLNEVILERLGLA